MPFRAMQYAHVRTNNRISFITILIVSIIDTADDSHAKIRDDFV